MMRNLSGGDPVDHLPLFGAAHSAPARNLLEGPPAADADSVGIETANIDAG